MKDMQKKMESIKQTLRKSLSDSMLKEGLMFDTAHIDITIKLLPVPGVVQITGVLKEQPLKEGITSESIQGDGTGNYFYKPKSTDQEYAAILKDIHECKLYYEEDYGYSPKGIHLSEKDYQILREHCGFEQITDILYVMGIEVLSTNTMVSYLE